MCFTASMSVGFAVLACLTALVLRIRQQQSSSSTLLLFFASMEMLQAAHYWVLEEECPRNDGGAPKLINQIVMLLSYLHICAQPFMLNRFVLGLQKKLTPDRPHLEEVTNTVLWFSGAAGGLMLLKALPTFGYPEEYLPFPWRMCTPGVEYFCGSVPGFGCGTAGRLHLAWKMRLLESGYVIPGLDIHFFWFFVPALLLTSWPLKALFIALLLLGPILVDRIYTGDREHYLVEGPAVWCFMSIAQVFFALATELLLVTRPCAQAEQQQSKEASKQE